MTPSIRQNWFDAGGETYARYRPEYPCELVTYLAQMAPAHACAVDVGCGTGQLTTALANRFECVIGLDPSADQLASATGPTNVRFAVASAESLPVADASASLITAAQAAHWFDLPAFYSQVQRVAQPDAMVALISYGVMLIDGRPGDYFQQFYHEDIGPYWPPERKLVDEGYADIPFPFDEFAAPSLSIRNTWSLQQVLGYIGTWSAVRRARDDGRVEMLDAFATRLASSWGDPDRKYPVAWPINMRIGRV